MTVADRLKAVRVMNGLSLREFSDRLGLAGHQRWGNIELSGKVSRQMLIMLHDKFGVSADWILFGEGRFSRIAPRSRDV